MFFAQSRPKSEQKPKTRNFIGFHNHSPLLNIVPLKITFKLSVFVTILCLSLVGLCELRQVEHAAWFAKYVDIPHFSGTVVRQQSKKEVFHFLFSGYLVSVCKVDHEKCKF